MSGETCILTTKDYTILEIMRDRSLGNDDMLAPILARKLDSALVVYRDDVHDDVATLSSRVTFSVNGRDPDTRVLTLDRMTSPVGLYLPIATPRGLALLGLSEGETFTVANRDGTQERVLLEKVHYQPEAARRDTEALERLKAPAQRRAGLRVVAGGRERDRCIADEAGGFDDPGPSAA